jgi:Flp pilus assembly CpaE family ATPase
MKTTRIVIVSPDPAAAAELAEGLRSVGFSREPENLRAFPTRGELRRILQGDEPADAVLLNYAEEQPALQCLRDIRAVRPETLTVMFNGSRRLSSLVKAKQGGVWGYLTDPADLTQLADHFGLSPVPPEEDKTGRLIGIIPAQGGNGASTVCLHVAERIAAGRPGDTLLLDCDLHTGTVAFQLGLEPRKTLLEALEDPNEENARSCASRWGDLCVLVGPADPERIFSGPLNNMDALLAAARKTYEYVVVDLPAPIYSSTTGILRAADRIYLVCTPEITSLHLAKRKIDRMRHLGVENEKLRLLLNRSGSNRALDATQIERITGIPVQWALDNDYRAVAQAALRGGLIPKETALAQQLEHLGELIVEELGAPRSESEAREPAPTGLEPSAAAETSDHAVNVG